MTEKELIEEMASCDNCIHKEVCYMHETYGDCAEEVKETGCFAYHRKILKGSVVLSKEEYERIAFYKELYDETKRREQKLNEFNGNLIIENQTLKDKLELKGKETAKEILKEILLIESVDGWQENKQLVDFGNKIVDKIERLAKQFGVEVK